MRSRLPATSTLIVAALLCVLVMVLAMLIGERTISLHSAWAAFLHPSADGDSAIVWGVRVPRIVAAALVGAALGMSGAALQGLTGNPLADPYLVGVASGASFGVGLGIKFGLVDLPGSPLLSLLAFACALAATVIVFALSRSQGRLNLGAFLLSGVIVGTFLAALVNLLLALQRSQPERILQKLMGYIDEVSWDQLFVLGGVVFFGLILLVLCGRGLDAFSFGEEVAHASGVNIERFKLGVLALIALLTAAAVAVSGVIGFVGLVVPHLARVLIGPPHKTLIPLSALFGAILLVLADLVARNILENNTLPIGIVTALVGAPVFVALLRRQA
jgi:iron complex transport system permease protein